MDLRDRSRASFLSPPPFSVSSKSEGRSALVTVGGDLDMATAGILEDLLQSMMSYTNTILLNTDDVTFVDCAGWHAVTSAAATLRARGGSLVVVAASKQVRRLVGLLGPLGVEMDPAIVVPHSGPYDGH